MSQKAGGGAPHEPIDGGAVEGELPMQVASPRRSPDEEYDRRCAETVLNHAWLRLEEEFRSKGEQRPFEQLKPAVQGDEDALEYAMVAREFGLTESAIKMRVKRARLRLSELIREEIAETVGTLADVEEELT